MWVLSTTAAAIVAAAEPVAGSSRVSYVVARRRAHI